MNLKRNTIKKKPRASINEQYLNRPENKNVQNKGLKLLNVIRGYSNNFKQNKRDFCPFLNGILLRFFKKVYPNLLCVPKKKKKNETKKPNVYIYINIYTHQNSKLQKKDIIETNSDNETHHNIYIYIYIKHWMVYIFSYS